MGYSTFDNRIKKALDIAEEEGIEVEIIEDEGESIGEHPNCAFIKAKDANGRYIEVIGISIGGGTIKIKGIHVNGLETKMNHGLPILTVDGPADKAQINHLINDLNDMSIEYKDELTQINDDKSLVVLPLNKAIKESALDTLRDKYSDFTVSYIN